MKAPKMDAAQAEDKAQAYCRAACAGQMFRYQALQSAFDASRGLWSVRCEFTCMGSLSPRMRLVLVDDESGKVVGGNEEVGR